MPSRYELYDADWEIVADILLHISAPALQDLMIV